MTKRSAALLCAAIWGCAHEQPRKAPAAPTPASSAKTTTQQSPPLHAAPPETPEAAFRAEKPPPLAGQPRFEAPVPVERKLKNGARALISEIHAVPLVSIDVLFGTGVNGEPRGKAGLAGFRSSMVTEGTRTRTTTQLAAALEDLAIELSAGAGNETSRVRLNTLKEALPKAVELLADVLQNPAFRPADVERVRRLKLAGLAQKQGNPGALAADEGARVLYGDEHPWGQPSGGTPESVSSISIDDLRAYQRAWYHPNNALISVAGDVSADEVVRLLDQHLARWKKAPVRKLDLPPFPELSARYIDALDKPGTTQSQVWVVGRLFDARHPDRLSMFVANEALGGLFTSRLNMNLRERHGYSYGVFSGVSLNRTYGTFTAAGGILAQHTAEAVREYEKELEKFVAEGPTDLEVIKAKETIIRSLPAALETNDAVAAALATISFNGLPLDYYRTVPDRIAKVTREDALRVAKRWIKPDQWPVIVVGPVGGAADALQALALGEVRLRPAPGVAAMAAGPRQLPAGATGPTAGSGAVPEGETGRPPSASPAAEPGAVSAPQPPGSGTPAAPPPPAPTVPGIPPATSVPPPAPPAAQQPAPPARP
jgi:zinc protease